MESYEKRPFNNLTDGSRGGGIRNKLNYHAEKYDAVIEEEKKRPELVADILKTKVKLSFKTFQSLPADVTWDLEEVLREIGLINS